MKKIFYFNINIFYSLTQPCLQTRQKFISEFQILTYFLVEFLNWCFWAFYTLLYVHIGNTITFGWMGNFVDLFHWYRAGFPEVSIWLSRREIDSMENSDEQSNVSCSTIFLNSGNSFLNILTTKICRYKNVVKRIIYRGLLDILFILDNVSLLH